MVNRNYFDDSKHFHNLKQKSEVNLNTFSNNENNFSPNVMNVREDNNIFKNMNHVN